MEHIWIQVDVATDCRDIAHKWLPDIAVDELKNLHTEGGMIVATYRGETITCPVDSPEITEAMIARYKAVYEQYVSSMPPGFLM